MLNGALFSAERVIHTHFRTGLGERGFLGSIGAWILTGYLMRGHFCFGLGDFVFVNIGYSYNNSSFFA